MIVKDEAANLPDCLASCQGLFDQIIIVDTGSTDDTIEIATDLGALVYPFEWVDDFSAARNFGLDRVTTDYVFRIDADDRIHAAHHHRLKRVFADLAISQPTILACRVEAKEPSGNLVLSDEYRCWPNRPTIRFHGRIHERIHPERDARDCSIQPSHVQIDHHGYADQAVFTAKLERNLRISLKELRESLVVVDPLLYFDIGRTYNALDKRHEARTWLHKFLSKANPSHTIAIRVAYRLLAGAYRATGNLQAAMATAQEGLGRFPDDALLVSWVADTLSNEGLTDLALEGYRRALKLYRTDQMDAGVPVDFRSQIVAAIERCEKVLDRVPV